MTPLASSALATSALAAPLATPAEPNGSAAVLRFRERVRARIGTAQLLAFRVGDERFAFDVRALDEAIEAPQIHASPLASSGAARVDAVPVLRGLAHVGGRSIPVFDTARLLGVREGAGGGGGGGGGHVLVMRSGTRRIGLLADDVDDVITIDLSAIKPPPIDAGDELMLGVTWDGAVLTAILDARALITSCQHRAGEVAT